MFYFRTIFLLFIFALITIVGSYNGDPDCDLSRARQEMYDKQARESEESAERMGRIGISCETSTSSGSSSGGSGKSGAGTFTGIFVGFFFLIWAAIGIWFIFVQRQKAMNAAQIEPYSGEVMGYGIDEKTKTVATSAPAGKNGETNV